MFGRVIDYQAKQVTYNVYSYYKKRKLDKSTEECKQDINLIDTISEVTGLSKSTVTRIIRDGNAMKAEEGVVNFKPQHKKHIRKKRIDIDEFTEAVIRRKVIQFYTVKNEVPSVKRLNTLLKQEEILDCSDEYLRQLLHKLGFTNAASDSTGMLRESDDIVSQRLNYLQAMKIFRGKGKDIFFLNETNGWKNQNNKDALKDMPSFVIVHVSGSTSFLNGTMLMIKMSPKSKEDLSFEHFENYDWVKDTVLPNVPPSSVFVLDFPLNEISESKLLHEKPTMASTRAEVEGWLNRHEICFKETASKSDLLQLIETQDAKTEYSIRKLIEEGGHEVLYLPRNHSDLNPAAMMWEEVRDKAGKTSAQKVITSYPKKKWETFFENVKANEEEYYSHDTRVDDAGHIMQLKKEIEDEDEEKSDTGSEGPMDCDF